MPRVQNRFYVYMYTRPYGDKESAYVGFGSGRRATHHIGRFENLQHSNKHFQNVYLKARRLGFNGLIFEYIKENITIDQAKDLEIELIAKIGRRDLGTGPLVNKTKGGEGSADPGPETREKLRNRFPNRKWSDEVKRKIAIGNSFKHPPERVLANSLSHQGEKHYMFGQHHTEETKNLLSERLSGENHYFFGQKWSEERRIKTMEGRRIAKEAREKKLLKEQNLEPIE